MVLGTSSLFARPALANPELDRRYALESIGVLRSWDNVDGLFGDYVSQAYKEYFAAQSRFVFIDFSKSDSALTGSKIPYPKLIEDPEVLGQVSRTFHAETVIRTKIYKEGPRYRFSLEWLQSPKMDLIASETFTLDQPDAGQSIGVDNLKASVQAAMDRMVHKVPFLANVTGRDNTSITMNIGRASEIHKDDLVLIATLDEVKKHPLLKSIVDWRLTPTGRAVVDAVDEGIAFAKVSEEEPGRQVAKYQKVIQIIPAVKKPSSSVIDDNVEEAERKRLEPPRLGWVAAGPWVGALSREFTSSSTVGKQGSAVFFGAKAEGQLWLNKEWFAELALGYGFAPGYSQTDLTTNASTGGTSVTPSVFQSRLDFGYTYFTSGDLLGPKGWLKLGYQSMSYTFPFSASEQTVSNSFRGLFLGIGGDLPVRDGFGAILNLDFGIITSGDESVTTLAVGSAKSVTFFLGGYYRLQPRMMIRAGFDITSQSADFVNGASLNQKVTSFAPSVVYFF